ncbi:MAG: hypothetical protein K6E85_09190 [Lachnospiraceae bacterium]|nr:hypothetical protein [Lachnospiraceae bacterium]
MKRITTILTILLTLVTISALTGTIKASASDLPAGYDKKFDIIDEHGNRVTISGTPGTTLTEQTLIVRLDGGKLVNGLAKGTDVTSWFACVSGGTKPAGIKVKVAANAPEGSDRFSVTFYGITQYANWDEFYCRVPYYYLFENGSTYKWYDVIPNQTGKFNIVREGSTSEKDVTFSPSNLEIKGEVNKALSGNYEITVKLNGVFLRNLSKGQDVTDWFKGKGTQINSNGTIFSFLPKGITVKVKNAVQAYSSNTMTLVFSGTPKEASIDAVSFTIPSGYAAIADSVKKCETSGEFTTSIIKTVSSNCRYAITGPGGYLRRGVLLDFGDQYIPAMSTIDENNPIVIKATLFGTDENGEPLKLKGDGRAYNGKELGQVTQNASDGGLKSTYGLTAKIRNWEEGKDSFEIVLTGTLKENSFNGKYPDPIHFHFELKSICNTSGVNLKTEEIGELWKAEPTLAVHTDEETISCALNEAGKVFFFTDIYLEDTKLAQELKSGTTIPTGTYTQSGYTFTNSGYKGIYISVQDTAKVGANKIHVQVSGTPSGTGSCYIPVVFEAAWLERYKSAQKLQYVTGTTNIRYDVWDAEDPVFPDDEEETGGNGNDGGNGGSGSNYSATDGHLRYPKTENIKIYAKLDDEYLNDVYIDLTEEKLICGKSYACYSVDGGSKYKQGKISDADFAKLLNKGMTLYLASSYDTKSKAPKEDAQVYTFAEINKRPAAPKLKVEYSVFADPTGRTPGQFIFTDNSGEVLSQDDIQLLDVAVAASDGKKPDEKGYGKWPFEGGVLIPEYNGKKVATATYLVRTSPIIENGTATPASKAVKVKVKGQQKAPKLKVDYKNEVLKIKAGMTVYFGDQPAAKYTEVAEGASSMYDYEGKYIKVEDKEAAKEGIDLSSYLTTSRNTIIVWTNATAKKPASAPQIIKLAARASIDEQALKPSGGKLRLDKKYEVYDEGKDKWVSLSTVSESCELDVRLKATAKGGKESDSTYAASDTATLVITYGTIDAKSEKEGVKSAEIMLK